MNKAKLIFVVLVSLTVGASLYKAYAYANEVYEGYLRCKSESNLIGYLDNMREDIRLTPKKRIARREFKSIK